MKKIFFFIVFVVISITTYADTYKSFRVYGLTDERTWMLIGLDTIDITITDKKITIHTETPQVFYILKTSEIVEKEEGFVVYMKAKSKANENFSIEIDFWPNEDLILYINSLQQENWGVAYVCNI